MGFNQFYTVLFAAFFLVLVQNASCNPKDATAHIRSNVLEEISRHDELKGKEELPAPTNVVPSVPLPAVGPEVQRDVFPRRVACQYEDVTEDPVCQEHCLPKGYSYGVCVSKTCSCI